MPPNRVPVENLNSKMSKHDDGHFGTMRTDDTGAAPATCRDGCGC